MEKNFDSRVILNGVFDFVTCQRPDGSYYGAGGAKCHKGSESSLPQSESKSGKVSAQAAAIASALTAKQFEEFGIEDSAKAAENLTAWEKETKAYVEKLKNGEVTTEEMNGMLVQHMDADPMKTDFLFIGMENGLDPKFPGTEYGAESAGQFAAAKGLAQRSLIEKGELTLTEATQASSMVEVANRNQVKNAGKLERPGNINEYIVSAASLASQASGGPRNLSREEADGAFFGGLRVATIEMSIPPASTVSDGALSKSGVPTLKKGVSSVDPNRSMYGAMVNGQAGSKFAAYDRAYVKKEFSEERSKFVGQQLKTAAQDNPRFQGGFGAPGAGANYTRFQQGVIDPLARSGVPVYETKVKLSTDAKPGSTAKGKRQTIENGKRVTTHTAHVADLGNGKYFVSGDYSMNTPGYAAHNQHLQAYQQAIANVKPGASQAGGRSSTAKATRYVPPSQKTAAPKASSATKASTARKQDQSSRQSTKRTASATKREAQQRAKRIGKEMKAAMKERDGTKPGSARNVAAREQLTTLKAQLKTAEEEAK